MHLNGQNNKCDPKYGIIITKIRDYLQAQKHIFVEN
jgi:hypothetical protein